MKRMKYLFSILLSFFLLSSCMGGTETIIKMESDNSIATIENRFVRIDFNLQDGTYDAFDKREDAICISKAFFKLNQYCSNSGFQFTWKKETVDDELGSGEKLVLTGTKDDSISLIFEMALYDNKSFISINSGVINTKSSELRVNEFHPLIGKAYNNFKFKDYKVLDGENDTYVTRVSTQAALESKNNILVTFGKPGKPKRSLVIGGLSYNEFQKYASVTKHNKFLEIDLKADDPVGKLVDADSTYILNDRFYVDFCTDNRFEALEKYGFALRDANKVEISGVDFPILNFWYAYIYIFGADEFKNNSPGVIEKMQEIKNTGFLKYAPVGVRLEPDDYAIPNNQQGWWDNEHWQMYKGGQLLEPYETIEKWGKKVRQLGGVPFIYCQTGRRSDDYCIAYPGHCLFNDPYKKRSSETKKWHWAEKDKTGKVGTYWAYDYTDPGFIRHMKDVYQNLRSGGVQGIKFDYPETGWAYDGGFEDKYATTTSAYRNIFKLAYEGLGQNRDVQERIPPFGDVALGVVTTQRTEGDNDWVYPARVSKTGLRWYKNRVVANYDHDPINPYHVYPKNSVDGWRAAITMTYLNSGRMEIGKYFGKMTEQHLYDLSRAMPLLAALKSPRPVDAFSDKEYPQIYDYKVDDSWHILTFYNYSIKGESWPDTDSAYGWGKSPHFQPKKMLPSKISVDLGAKTDDGGLALSKNKMYYVFDFWNWKFVGKIAGDQTLKQNLRPGETRIMAVHEVRSHPQFVSTNRHILQGLLDMEKQPQWDPIKKELSGISKVIKDEPYKMIIASNGFKVKNCTAENSECKVKLFDAKHQLYELTIKASANSNRKWSVIFE